MIKSIATLPKPSLKEVLGLVGLALPIGVVVGVVDVIFGKGFCFFPNIAINTFSCFFLFFP
ncbi:chloride channel protein [Streptococcus dysgalactiae]|nr:chloride channel protein [Streptococcus dysgalactiae]